MADKEQFASLGQFIASRQFEAEIRRALETGRPIRGEAIA